MPGTFELLTLAVAAVAGLVLLDAAIRRSLVGIGVVLVVSAAHTTFPILPSQGLGGVTILMWDMVGMLLLAAAIARLLRGRGISGVQWLLIAFGLLMLLSLAQGIVAYGLNAAVVESRNRLHFFSIALYFSTVEPDRRLLDRIGYVWLCFAGFLLLLALVRWAVLPLGLEGWAKGPPGLRVVAASPTLAMLQAFVIGAVAWIRGDASSWLRRLVPAVLASVVILQHRTVWAVLVVVIALIVLLQRGAVRKLVPLVVLGVVVVAALSMTILDMEATELADELGEQAGERNTWEWRKEGWQALLEQKGPQEPMEYLFGLPFGTGWDRVMDGRLVRVSAHNYYVEAYLRTGLLGLAVLAALYVTLLWRLGRARDAGGLLASRVFFLVLVAHPIFFMSYSPDQVQGVLLGLAVAAASTTSWQSPALESRMATGVTPK